VLLLLALPRVVSAQTCVRQSYESAEPPDMDCPGPGEDVLVPELELPASLPVRRGETVLAPWDGALVHRDRLVYLGLRIRALRRLRWLDTLRLTERCTIVSEHQEEVAQIREELLRAQAEDAERRAATAEQRSEGAEAWYRSVWFGIVLGAVGAGLLVVLAAYLVTAI